MKLSKKGLKRFWKRVNDLDTFQDNHTMWDYQDSLDSELEAICKVIKQEFEPDDFEGCVVLTVEEAKEIHDMLADNENYFPEGLWDMGHWLKNKIEQAEKSNE